MSTYFYYDNTDNKVSTDPAKVVAVKVGEEGYYTLQADLPADVMNPPGVTEEVLASAMCASMFGWDVDAAKPALEFAAKHEAETLKRITS